MHSDAPDTPESPEPGDAPDAPHVPVAPNPSIVPDAFIVAAASDPADVPHAPHVPVPPDPSIVPDASVVAATSDPIGVPDAPIPPVTAEMSVASEMPITSVAASVTGMPGIHIAPDAADRRLHPLTLLFSTGEVARQLIFPAVVGGISAGDGDVGRIILIVVLVLAVPAAGVAVARYLRFRYALTGDELVIRSGLLSRTHRVIPLARVQNVDVKQGVLQRLLRVAELRVETAGAGAEAEAALSVLGAADAQALRGELLARRRAARAGTAAPAAQGAPETAEDAAPVDTGRLLKKLSFGDVVLAGATANEAGVIAAAVAGSLQLVDDVGLPYLDRLGDASDWVLRAVGVGAGAVLLVVAGLAVLLMILGWAVSIVGAVVRYHGFTLTLSDGELRKRYGLLTLHEASVPLERVQAVRVEESVLRRALGLASLMIETAGAGPGQGGEGGGGAEAFVPLARRGEVAALVRGIFGDFHLDESALRQVHPRARRRAALRWAVRLLLPAALLATAAVVTDEHLWLPLLLPVLPLPWILARREYAIRGYAVAGGYVVARAGVLGRVTWIVPERKLQTLHLRQSPMQRRHGLASLVVDTAAGGRQAVIDDLAADDARELLDVLASGIRESARARRRRRPRADPSAATIEAGDEEELRGIPSAPSASPA